VLTLVIADDSAAVRKALRNFFKEHPQFQIIGEAATYADTISRLADLSPDVLLLDLRMPGFECRAEEVSKDSENVWMSSHRNELRGR
jgi:DNA-binding NarL/FixJ family response regulator